MVVAGSLVATVHSSAAAPDPNATAVVRADQALQQHRADIRASGADGYKAYRSTVDKNGKSHVRYTRTYHGLRVYGGDFVVHTGPTGAFAGVSVGLLSPLTLDPTPKVDAAVATKTARAHFTGKVISVGKPELFVDASRGTGRLAWETVVVGWAPDGQTPSRLHVISDAVTGGYVGAFDEIEDITGTGNGITTGTVTIDTSTTAAQAYVLTAPVLAENYVRAGHSTFAVYAAASAHARWT
jgi:Zn-dependent metalloprotease